MKEPLDINAMIEKTLINLKESTRPDKLYDFYYSAKNHEQNTLCPMPSYIFENSGRIRPIYPKTNYVNGKIYTECVKHGSKPTSLWEDNVFIGTFRNDQIERFNEFSIKITNQADILETLKDKI